MKRIISIFIFCFLPTFVFPQIEPRDTDGDGFLNVSTLEHLKWLSEVNKNMDIVFELDNDIDASATRNWNVGDHDLNPATPDSAMGWGGLMGVTKSLYGFDRVGKCKIEGHGHSIYNLYINRPLDAYVSFVGVFSTADSYIDKLNLKHCEITGYYGVGGLVGIASVRYEPDSLIYIRNCSVTGRIRSTASAGGIIGEVDYGNIIIENCSVQADIVQIDLGLNYSSYKNSFGGICGYNFSGKLKKCSFVGYISGVQKLGGIVGRNTGMLFDCTADVEIKGSYYIGGICGSMGGSMAGDGWIYDCESKCDILGERYVGGICGGAGESLVYLSRSSGNIEGKYCVGGIAGIYNDGDNYRACYMTDSYSIANIKGDSLVGGLIGFMYGYERYRPSLYSSYFAGTIEANHNFAPITGYAGGFTTECFWDAEKTGFSTDSTGIGYSTAEMKNKQLYLDKNWNFISHWKINSDINDGYPYLDIETIPTPKPIEPFDTDGDSLLNVSNLQELLWLAHNRNRRQSFELDNSINCAETFYWDTYYGFLPIGFNEGEYGDFSSDFNGNGFSIDSLYINTMMYRHLTWYMGTGFFGQISGRKRSVKNVKFKDCYISGRANIGILAGTANTNISDVDVENCSTRSFWRSGGLVGFSISSEINHCSVIDANVKSRHICGGLIGISSGDSLFNCFAMGKVKGFSKTGGLIGLFQEYDRDTTIGLVRNCYSVCPDQSLVGTIGFAVVENSFWDNEIGLSTDSVGTGMPTLAMHNKSTFTNAGWDFDKIWDINPDINSGYPFFKIKGVSIIDEVENKTKILIYPNPAQDFISIETDDKINSIKIYDTLGKLVKVLDNSKVSELEIDISSLVSGAYYLEINCSGETYQEIFIKE